MISKLADGFSVKCDRKECGYIMTFEYERSFSRLIERMKEVGWKSFFLNEGWVNYCPKCVASSADEKDFFENQSIVLDSEETDIIFRARKFFKGRQIFLEPREVLKKIIDDFGEELSLMERDLKAEEHAPDLFSNEEDK